MKEYYYKYEGDSKSIFSFSHTRICSVDYFCGRWKYVDFFTSCWLCICNETWKVVKFKMEDVCAFLGKGVIQR